MRQRGWTSKKRTNIRDKKIPNKKAIRHAAGIGTKKYIPTVGRRGVVKPPPQYIPQGRYRKSAQHSPTMNIRQKRSSNIKYRQKVADGILLPKGNENLYLNKWNKFQQKYFSDYWQSGHGNPAFMQYSLLSPTPIQDVKNGG